MRLFLVAAVLLAGCSSVSVDPYAVPIDDIPEPQRTQVQYVLSDVAAVVPLQAADVHSRPEVYDFLLSEMPFTAGIVRELGRGNWDIFRDPEKPDKKVFYVNDPGGMKLRFELIFQDAIRRIFVSRGVFHMGILPALQGRTVIVMRAVPGEGVIHTDAVVYVKVEQGFYSGMAKASREMLAQKVREKCGFFIQASTWVAEEVATRPDWLYTQVLGSKEVDQEILEDFRKKFIAR